jgi:hypothetical protein
MGALPTDDRSGRAKRSFPPPGLHALKPTPTVLRRSAIAAFAFLIPSTVVTFLLTIPNGALLFVFAIEIAVLIALVFSVFRFSRAGFWVGTSGIAERGFFGTTRFVPVHEIGSIVVVEKFENIESDPIPQLFVCDSHGKQLIRMRGQFWTRKSMDFVSETLPVPVNEVVDPISAAELLAEYPGLLYWFERHPVVAATVFAAAIVVGGVVLYAILSAVGVTGRA